MKAIILKEFGGVQNLTLTDMPVPAIQDDEVLIRVEAISINPVDVKTRAGKGVAGLIKDRLPAILGWDISGVITEVGDGVDHFKTGDEVFGMLSFPNLAKAYAEYVAAPASELALKPVSVDTQAAAAATLAALTAFQALTHHATIKSGDRVLIHAASGGVGHYAVQIAKHLGAFVIATSSAANKDFVLSLGADEHIDYKTTTFEEVARGIDFVLDTIGGEYIDRSLRVIKKGGAIISIPSGLNEAVAEKAKAMGITGSTMKVQPSGDDMKAIAALLKQGIIRSHVSKTFGLEDIQAAHEQLETGRTVGKVVVKV